MLRHSLCFPLALLLLAAAAAPDADAQATQTRVDYVILIDVSGSMAGRPAGSGNVNIFPKVQEALAGFISELEPGSSVFITPFAEVLGATRRFDIANPSSASAAEAYIRSLEATGTETHVYGAMGEAFRRYNAIRGDQEQRIGVLMVFTDGNDNGPEGLSMADVVQQFGLQRQQDDFIYYATLGVQLPPGEAAALAGSGFAAHDPSPAGDVHPVRVVQPRYRLLSFGNLQNNPRVQKTLGLDLNGALPAGFGLQTRTSFPGLERRGIYVEVAPSPLPVSEEVRLGLRLVNAEEMPTGDFEGTIELTSPDPQVIVVPRRISARFTYAPPRHAQVLPASGSHRPELLLGEMDPLRADEGRDTASGVLRLELDKEAAARGGSFMVRVRQDPRNPAQLAPEALRVNGAAGDLHSVDVARRSLRLGVLTDRGNTPAGRYRGTLVLEDGSVQVQGAREIPWEFEVRRPPLAPAAIAALAALALAALVGVGLFVRYWMTGGVTPPRLKGRLTVRAPDEAFGQEINLTGHRQVTVGSGSAELPGAGGRIRIVPERGRTYFRVKVVAEDGTVVIRRQGEPYDVPVATESLEEGDLIALPPYRVEYSKL